MNPVINALNKANSIIDELINSSSIDERRENLMKLDKADLVNIILAAEKHKKTTIKEIAYSLLTDDDCTWLSYEQLAGIIQAKVPGAKTSEDGLRWYYSQQQVEGIDCKPRKTLKEITKAILAAI